MRWYVKKLMWTVTGVVCLSLLTTSCTREAEKASQINLSLKNIYNSKIGAQSIGSNVSHIVVNIQGAGLPGPIVWNWDAHHNGTMLTPPDYVRLDVPKGTARLIQILLVSETESGAEEFSYGDVVKDLVAEFESVTIVVNSVSGGGSGVQGQVGGRYLNVGGTSGPTGELELLFTPPVAGRPKMKIMDVSMINGWFNLFLIDGAAFSYRFKHSGLNLFDGTNLDLNGAVFSPLSQTDHLLHLIQPAGISAYMNNGATPTTETRGEERYIAGFFGPGAASVPRAACYNTTAGSVSNMYTAYTNNTTNTPMWYDPNSGVTTKVRRLNSFVGKAIGVGICGTGTEYDNILKIDGKNVGSGKGRTFGFESVFKISSSSYNAIQATYSSGVLTLSWNYLPDVIGVDGVDGVSVFVNTTGLAVSYTHLTLRTNREV